MNDGRNQTRDISSVVILGLHRAALTLIVVCAAAMVFCIAAGFIAYLAGHVPGANLVRIGRSLVQLAAVFSWSGGLLLLSIAGWLILESWLAAFKRGAA